MIKPLPPQKNFLLVCLLLALGTAAVYWPVTRYPFILFDDPDYLTENLQVMSGLSWENFRWAFTGAHAANWHPLTWLGHQANCTLFGFYAGGHHFINLLLHVANTLLVLVFLHQATGRFWRSAVVAALFAWHPLHVESVAWAAELKDVLCAFFFLLALVCYVRWGKRDACGVMREKSSGSRLTPHSSRYYLLALFFFACALMSKPMAVTLPFVLLLVDIWPLKRILDFRLPIADFKKLLIEKIPFFALSAASCVVTYLAQSGAGAVAGSTLASRLANAVIAYVGYVAKIFWPVDLAIVYSRPHQWPVELALGTAGLLLFWTLLAVRCWRKNRSLAVGWFWFLGTLLPTIGLVQVGSQAMADRYAYLPSLGIFTAVVWGAADFFASRVGGKNILRGLSGVALAGCLWLTARQISFWQDDLRLFSHAAEVSPNNYMALNALGLACQNKGDWSRATDCFETVIGLEPRWPLAQYHLAMCRLQVGDVTNGLKHLEIARTEEPQHPGIQYNLGVVWAQRGDWSAAAQGFSNSIAIRPGFAPAQANYANALEKLGDSTNAAARYRAALRLNPDQPTARTGLQQLLQAHPELR